MAPRTKASACLVLATAAVAFVWWWRLRHVQVPADTPWLEEELHSVASDRLFAATVVGIALGVGGLLLRTATANPLADPSITGVNSGAALGAVATAMILGSEASSVDQLPGALLGAGIAVGVTVGVGKSGAIQRMVLVGVAVSALCSALTSIFLVIDEAQLATVMSWLSGRLAGVRLDDIIPALIAVLVVVPLTLVGAKTLDLLVAGDAVAGAVGAKPERTRLAAIVAAVVLIAPAVAATGPIGFL
ncbi:MAG: iron ABC transporter permease, partial [Staphylococcus hominis]